MMLADKIIKLRKEYALTQEELAEKMDVSRQSVSKWESGNSLPDLNKILLLSTIFNVSTDYLMKEDIESVEAISVSEKPSAVKISKQETLDYLSSKVEVSKVVTKGVLLCVYSIVPLLLLLSFATLEQKRLFTAIGLASLFTMVVIGVRLFIQTSLYKTEWLAFEEGDFEITSDAINELSEKSISLKEVYSKKVSTGVGLMILSVVPLIISILMFNSERLVVLMVALLLLFIGIGLKIIIPISTEYNTLNYLLKVDVYAPERIEKTKRIEKIGLIYLAFVTALYIGWSLWTMDWGRTWIIWPVFAIGFGPLVGLISLFEKKEK